MDQCTKHIQKVFKIFIQMESIREKSNIGIENSIFWGHKNYFIWLYRSVPGNVADTNSRW